MNAIGVPIVLALSTKHRVRCVILSDGDDLHRLESDWLDLLQRSATNEPMLAPSWLLPWLQVYGKRRLRVSLFYDEDRLVGLAPLQRWTCCYRPGIPFRRLELLGAAAAESAGVCSRYLNFIMEQGYEDMVLSALSTALISGRFGSWDELVIPAMNGDLPVLDAMEDTFCQAGLTVEITKTADAPYISLPGTWEEYLHSRGEQGRHVVKALHDFDEWAGSQAEFREAATLAELEEGKRILQDLHADRWRNAGQKGIFGSTRSGRFHELATRRLLDNGALQLHWLTVRGKPVAAIYNICWNNKIYHYQSGRIIDVPNNIHLAIVLHAHCIRAAIAQGCREYDFLADVSEYKRKLATATRPLVQFRLVRSSLREQLRQLADKGIGQVRHYLKRKS